MRVVECQGDEKLMKLSIAAVWKEKKGGLDDEEQRTK